VECQQKKSRFLTFFTEKTKKRLILDQVWQNEALLPVADRLINNKTG
jgi:hypothetical protein